MALLHWLSPVEHLVEGAALAPINAQINAALPNVNFGVPVYVEAGDGALTVSLAQ